MRARVPSLLMRPGSPPVLVGIAIATAFITAETLVVYPLRQVAPPISLGVVYLLGVLVVSSTWGLALGEVTAVVSTAAFDFFHVPPNFTFLYRSRTGEAALIVLLVVALLLSLVAALAGSRASEADERRREADLAAEMARLLLRSEDLRSALPRVSARLARALGLSNAAIELEVVAGDEHRAAFPLRDGDTPLGTLLVPGDLPHRTEARVRERVVPSVEALLHAAREREAMGSALAASRDELRALAEQQAALRRVATRVAQRTPPKEVFAAVTEEIGQLLPVDFALMGRYETDGTVTAIAAWGTPVASFPVGGRWDLGGKNLVTIVGETGRPARIDRYADSSSGSIGVTGRESGFNSTVGAPILVEGRLWGVMAVGSTLVEPPLPADTETRLAQFTELLATAVANAESRAALTRLAEEQAALQRVATLVAAGAPAQALFAAVVEEVGQLLPVDLANMCRYEGERTQTFVATWSRSGKRFPQGERWPLGGKNVGTFVFETRSPARIDDYSDASGPVGPIARETGLRSAVGTPIIVEGRLWGMISVGSSEEQSLPPETEERLASFTELVATAIANAESRAGLARLAEEQAALRRVATLVAQGAQSNELFAAVTGEVGQLLPVDFAVLCRYDPEDTLAFIAGWGPAVERFPPGTRWDLGGHNVSTLVLRTGRPARVDGYSEASAGPIGVTAREGGIETTVGAPILVESRLWGVMTVGSTLLNAPLPADTDARLAQFTELLATAIANAESRAGLGRLAAEQAALRRLATLVARSVPQDEVFAAVAQEAGRLLPVDFAIMGRYEDDGAITCVASWGAPAARFPVGSRSKLEGENLVTIVLETGRPARVDHFAHASGPIGVVGRESGFHSAVGTPIVVDGLQWGVMTVGCAEHDSPLPTGTETRLASFTELVATAISNAESRAELAQLAEQQAALRRVATLVARGTPPHELFAAVIDEVGQLLPVESASMCRYESDGFLTFVAVWGKGVEPFPVGSRQRLGGKNLGTIVFETGRPARLDRYAETSSGPLGAGVKEAGIRSSVAAPITVEGRLWGGIVAGSVLEQPLPADTESRLMQFTELVGTAISNAESRAALAASRARIVAATDESRRGIERDLHDGAQQRLVHAVIVLKLAQRALEHGDANSGELVAEALRHAEEANSELRELAHGILPAALTRGGLRAGVEALVSRVALPVSVDITVERLPASVEATAYFVVSEALTNVVKHAQADGAGVTGRVEDGQLRVEVRDDGVGGARGDHTTGLGGLEDRVSALGGRLVLDSPRGGGTRVCALLPVSG